MSYDWRDDAACLKVDPELFFVVCDNTARRLKLEAAPKAVCRGCPVVVECLNFALDNELSDGIFGGFNEIERQAILERRRRAAYTNTRAAAS